MISDILKEESKFTAVMNARKTFLRPILTCWGDNNIKNALYAMNEYSLLLWLGRTSVLLWTLSKLFYPHPSSSRQSPQMWLSHYFGNQQSLCLASIIGMYATVSTTSTKLFSCTSNNLPIRREELIKIKAFSPLSRADLSRE